MKTPTCLADFDDAAIRSAYLVSNEIKISPPENDDPVPFWDMSWEDGNMVIPRKFSKDSASRERWVCIFAFLYKHGLQVQDASDIASLYEHEVRIDSSEQ